MLIFFIDNASIVIRDQAGSKIKKKTFHWVALWNFRWNAENRSEIANSELENALIVVEAYWKRYYCPI